MLLAGSSSQGETALLAGSSSCNRHPAAARTASGTPWTLSRRLLSHAPYAVATRAALRPLFPHLAAPLVASFGGDDDTAAAQPRKEGDDTTATTTRSAPRLEQLSFGERWVVLLLAMMHPVGKRRPTVREVRWYVTTFLTEKGGEDDN